MESQDTGFEYGGTTEIDIKEHRIEQAEEPTLLHRPPDFIWPPFPHPLKTGTTPAKLIARNPRLRQVSLASLYGRTATPMADPQGKLEEGPTAPDPAIWLGPPSDSAK